MTDKVLMANICTAFAGGASIGSKVVREHVKAWDVVSKAITNFEYPENGQGFIVCPELMPMLRSGDAPTSDEVSDWVLRSYRGKVNKFLRAELADAIPVTFCALIAYTKEAYLVDPDVCGSVEDGIPEDTKEMQRVKNSLDCSHVLVAVLGTGGPKPAVSPYRFVMNLAGGNNEYKDMSGDDIRAKAKDIKDNQSIGWSTVAD